MGKKKAVKAEKPKQVEKKIEDEHVSEKPKSSFYQVSFFIGLVAVLAYILMNSSVAVMPKKKTQPVIKKEQVSPVVKYVKEPENIYSPEYQEIINCPLYPSPGKDFKQKCCKLVEDKLSCLPNLVVLGAQKAGTTALHSYLLKHPSLQDGIKKEFHFWDFNKNFNTLPAKMRSILPKFDEEQTSRKIVFDSTPSYLADHKACVRMATFLPKDARFVILLRNPVERTWSDVQMKLRRIARQTHFLQVILPKYTKELAGCLKTCTKCNYVQFRDCLPHEIGHHGRFIALMKYLSSGRPNLQKFTTFCLESEQNVRQCVAEFQADMPFLNEPILIFPDVLYEEIKRHLGDFLLTCCDPAKNASAYELAPMVKGRQDLPLPPQSQKDEKCLGCGCSCFPQAAIMADVTVYHVWRSLYYPQVVHCYQQLGAERILLVNSDDLRKNATGVLEKISKHAHLPLHDFSNYTEAELNGYFKERYPEFEAISGWSHDESQGETDDVNLEITPEAKQRLEDFFRPFNKKLFELLKIEPFPGWSV